MPSFRKPLAIRATLTVAAAVALSLGHAPSAHAQASGSFSFNASDIVVAVEGDGAGTGTYADGQASPLSLYQYATTGTSSATQAGMLVLPQTSIAGGNYAVSGEYGSSSEGTLQLSGNGQYLTIMGYATNADSYNSVYDVNGTGTALAQSPNVTGNSADVSRVIALIGANGSVNSTTAISNVFNENNPRSVYTTNGTSFYISGQGNKDNTGGVFYVANSRRHHGDRDHRRRHVEQKQRYLQPGYPRRPDRERPAHGQRGLQRGHGQQGPRYRPHRHTRHGRQSADHDAQPATHRSSRPERRHHVIQRQRQFHQRQQRQRLSEPRELLLRQLHHPLCRRYRADSKNGTQGTASGNLGDGGLQKWSLVNGTWTLDYTLSTGLNLVANTSSHGVSGLYGLTGKVVGNQVELFATSYVLGDTDQTYLYGITDALSDTSASQVTGEDFSTLEAAPADSEFKGVSLAPVPLPPGLPLLLGGLVMVGLIARRSNVAPAQGSPA